MAGETFLGTLYNEIITSFSGKAQTYAEAIGSAVKPLFGACIMLFVLYQVYRLYTDRDFMVEKIINGLVVFTVISAFIYGGNIYFGKIMPFVLNAGDEIAMKLNGDLKSSINSVDSIYNAFEKGFSIIETQLEQADGKLEKLGMYFQIAAPWLALFFGQLIFSVFITMNLIIAKIMVVLLLSVGVIFFCFAAFPATRGLFSSFTGLCLNYILLNVLYAASAKLASDFLIKRLGEDGEAIMANAGIILIATIIMVLAINQVPTLVSSLTGGVGISPFTVSSNGFAKAASALGLNKAARAAGSKTVETTKKAASSAWNKFRGKGSATN